MKKILITGATGMLGSALVNSWQNKYDLFATGRGNSLDTLVKNFMSFDLKSENYKRLVDWSRPDVIVHCAAIIDGEYCSKHNEEASLVNGFSVQKLITAAHQAKIIFISSDAVFPRETHLASEDTKTGPDTVYGKSKELGESFILESNGNNCIIRTTIVGKNMNPQHSNKGLVGWIVNSLRNGDPVTLFDDVLIAPISTWHLAEELEWVIGNEVPPVLHISGSEITTKYELGYKTCERLRLPLDFIRRGSLDEVPFIDKRTKDQTLNCSKYQSLSKRKLPGLQETVDILCDHYKE